MKFYSGIFNQFGYPFPNGVETSCCIIFTPDPDNYIIWGILSSIDFPKHRYENLFKTVEYAVANNGIMYIVKIPPDVVGSIGCSDGWDCGYIYDEETRWVFALGGKKGFVSEKTSQGNFEAQSLNKSEA